MPDELRHEIVRGVREELGGGRVLHELARAHDRDAVAELDGLVDVVRHEDDGDPEGALKIEKLVLQSIADDRIDGAEGLVHEHERGLGGHGARDADALALAARELRGVALLHVPIEADQGEQLVDSRADAVSRPTQELGDRGDVRGDGLVREQPDLLDHVADPPSQRDGILVQHVLPVDEDLAGGRLDQPIHHPERRRLAAARRPHEHANPPGGDREGELIDREGAAVPLGHAAELDGRAAQRSAVGPRCSTYGLRHSGASNSGAKYVVLRARRPPRSS